MEKCAGCGVEAEKHPMVAVGENEQREMVAVPVCLRCWERPWEAPNKVKGHYFERAQTKLAVVAAKAQIMLEEPTEEQRAAQKKFEEEHPDRVGRARIKTA